MLTVSANLCLSESGRPNNRTNSVPVEQNTCQNGTMVYNHQRWFIQCK